MMNTKFDTICVVGGGANAEYLNKLTSKYTEKNVQAGPTEATAIGNIVIQLIANGEIENLSEARKIIHDSFQITKIQRILNTGG